MKILLGTTNPSKAKTLAAQLEGYPVEICTLTDLGIEKHPDEDGKNPLENAMIKAAYYGQFHEPVIAEDSALYIKELPMDDPRQPGLFIARAPDGHRMTDDEMLAHYRDLAHSLGGRITACYLDGYAVYKDGNVSGYIADDENFRELYSFYLVDKPHSVRHPGWPLDSISIDPRSGLYFTEQAERDFTAEKAEKLVYRERLKDFYIQALGLTQGSGDS